MCARDSREKTNTVRVASRGRAQRGTAVKFSRVAEDEPVVVSASTSGIPVQRLLYDKQTAAEMLSISLRSLNYQLSGGKIRFRRMGSRVLIPHAELVRFAHGHHPEPVAGERPASQERSTCEPGQDEHTS